MALFLETPLIYGYLYFTEPHFHISSTVWGWTLLAALAQLVSFAAYLVAMSITDASLVLGLTAAYPIVSQLLAVAWLHESFSGKRIFAALAIAVGVLAIGASKHQQHQHLSGKRRLLLGACIDWGFTLSAGECGRYSISSPLTPAPPAKSGWPSASGSWRYF